MVVPFGQFGLPVETRISCGYKDADIPRKNLVKQGSQTAKLVTNGQAFKFRYSEQLLISSPLFV